MDYTVDTSSPYAFDTEMLIWCVTNFGLDKFSSMLHPIQATSPDEICIKWKFSAQEDKILFKLAWGQYIV